MPELLIQRRDRSAYFESYPLYVNRKQAGRIAFGETLSLDLAPGRYQINCGGLFGKEAEIWLDLNEHRKAIFLHSEALAYRQRPFPKYYQCHFTETSPLQLKGEESQAQLKAEQNRALVFAFAFAALLSLASAWSFWQSKAWNDNLFIYLGIVLLLIIPWAYRGVLISQLKRKA